MRRTLALSKSAASSTIAERPKWSIDSVGKTIGAAYPVRPGVVSPPRPVPSHIQLTNYFYNGNPGESPSQIQLQTGDAVNKLRNAATLARKMLDFANSLAKPGVTTDEIDRLTHEEIIKNGACPSPINYHGFPKSICTSINEVACHGIPDNRPLMDGDMLSIDISVFLDGYHGDNCGTVIVGEGDDVAKHILKTTQDALRAAVAICRPGS